MWFLCIYFGQIEVAVIECSIIVSIVSLLQPDVRVNRMCFAYLYISYDERKYIATVNCVCMFSESYP